MTRRHPPTIAAWLLTRVRNESLTGDLLEQFSAGRTSAWFWRQTFAALVSELSRRMTWEIKLATIGWTIQLMVVLWARALQINLESRFMLAGCMLALFAIPLALARAKVSRVARQASLAASAIAMDCINGLLWNSIAGSSVALLVMVEAFLLWQGLRLRLKAGKPA